MQESVGNQPLLPQSNVGLFSVTWADNVCELVRGMARLVERMNMLSRDARVISPDTLVSW